MLYTRAWQQHWKRVCLLSDCASGCRACCTSWQAGEL